MGCNPEGRVSSPRDPNSHIVDVCMVYCSVCVAGGGERNVHMIGKYGGSYLMVLFCQHEDGCKRLVEL